MAKQTTYTYSLSQDFPGGQINTSKLQVAIQNSTIVTPLTGINTNGDAVGISFTDVLSAGDKTTLDNNQSHPAGGLIASTDTTPFLDNTNRFLVLGVLLNANLNTTADQAIYLQTANYIVRRITCWNASGSVTLAIGGIYTGKNKSGTAVVPATQAYAGLAAGKYLDCTLNNLLTSNTATNQIAYFSLTTANGSARTMNIAIIGDDLTP